MRPQADPGTGQLQGWQTGSSKNPANQQDEKTTVFDLQFTRFTKGLGWSWQTRPGPQTWAEPVWTGRDQDPVCWGPSGRLGLDASDVQLDLEVGPAARSPRRKAGTRRAGLGRSARHRTALCLRQGGRRHTVRHWVPGRRHQAPPLEAKARCLRRLLVLGEGD